MMLSRFLLSLYILKVMIIFCVLYSLYGDQLVFMNWSLLAIQNSLHSHSHTHTHAHTYTHMHTHTHGHTHTYARMHAHTHMHTHTHTLAPRSIAAEMVVVETSAEPLSVNFTVTYVSTVVSTSSYFAYKLDCFSLEC